MTDKLEIHQGEPVEVRQGNDLPNINLQNAIDSAVTLGRDGVEVLERLHVILKDERETAAKKAFREAKQRVLKRLKPIPKRGKRALTKDNARKGVFHHYALTEDITAALIEAGAHEEGFDWRFDCEYAGEYPMATVILSHDLGHSETSRLPIIPARENDAVSKMDALKSGVSQASRVCLQSVWSIQHMCEDLSEDAPTRNVETVTDEEALKLEAALRQYVENGGGDEAAVEDAFTSWKNWAGVKSFADFPRTGERSYESAMEKIAQRMGAK